jgi:hypothetical protein
MGHEYCGVVEEPHHVTHSKRLSQADQHEETEWTEIGCNLVFDLFNDS